MAYDLMAGRPTEIDSLQGEIIRLADQQGRPAPICARVAALVSQASANPGRSNGLSPAQTRP